jgi:hypothetical protein
MNELQVKTQTQNSIVLSDQKKALQLSEMSEGQKVRDTASEKLIQFLSFQISKSYQLSGLKKLNENDSAFVIQFLSKEIKKNFSSLSSMEIESAFESGICGEYGDFNKGLGATTFVQFLRAYSKEKRRINNTSLYRISETEKTENEMIQKEIEKQNIEFLKNKYAEFISLVNLAKAKVYNSERFTIEFSALDVSSYTSSIEQQEENLLISDNQINWINKKIENLSFDYDSSKFGTGSKGKKSFEKFKKHEKTRLFNSVCLQLHFGNKIAQDTGVSISDFLDVTL